MLFPQSNSKRRMVDLSGYWDFRPDTQHMAADQKWQNGFSGGRPLVVPGSWNDQLEDLRNFLGDGWYQTTFDAPWGWNSQRLMLRFGSVNYLAEVWLNGTHLGSHEGGHLPFEFDVTALIQPEGNKLVVKVDADLQPTRVPPGRVPDRGMMDAFGGGQYPDTSYDFFPYAGIHRPVYLYSLPQNAITDLTVVTAIEGTTGKVTVTVEHGENQPCIVKMTLSGHGVEITGETTLQGETATATFAVENAALWSTESPNLYDLTVDLVDDNGGHCDRYTLPVGIRTIAVEGDKILLNGKPIYLTGFGRHEDFPIAGRGYQPLAVIKDYDLMRWIGANSFRTSHYPYSEQMLQMADRLGFLVISETPAVGLFFHEDGLEDRNRVWESQIRELIARDKNHPSVIMWSLANEPHTRRAEAKAPFKAMFDLARSLDDTRPVVMVSHLGLADNAMEFSDVICMNRYNAWYSNSGQLDAGIDKLSHELDALYKQYGKPIIMTEFGADTVPGLHRWPPSMFSEEYQVAMLSRYIELFRSKPYFAGEHIWNLCDFGTGQGTRRIGEENLKGVFTRDRKPKMAAHRLREIWTGKRVWE